MILTEHSCRIETENHPIVSAEMEVFYNPIMASNRNISILLLNSIFNREMNIADPLAGSGIRSLRFLKELEKGKIKNLFINDGKENFPKRFVENMKLNKIRKAKNMIIGNEDASLFLLHHIGFDYIDIDPFGSPNPFLAAAVARISRGGIIAVTATDTAALTGTYPKVTPRKYWAKSMKNYLMHELGLRILIRKVQLQGVQFDKALIPLLSYHKDHYFRIYFQNIKGKDKCDALLKQHQYFLFCRHCLRFKTSSFNKKKCRCGKEYDFAGPLWAGDLFDKKLIAAIAKHNPFPEEQKFLNTLAEEAQMQTVGFYDLHELARKYKQNPPPMENSLARLKAVRTHFSPNGIKTKKDIKEVEKLYG